jgi:hypothetical protein
VKFIMNVELFGHAGSGKTSTAIALCEKFGVEGHSALYWAGAGKTDNRWLGRRREELEASLAFPRAWLLGFMTCLFSRNVGRQQLGLLGTILRRAKTSVDRCYAGRVVVVDEGVLHGLWSFLLNLDHRNEKLADLLIRQMPMPDVGVLLQVDPALALRRIENGKPSHRLTCTDPNTALKRLRRQEPSLKKVGIAVQDHGILIRQEISEGVGAPDIADQIFEKIGSRTEIPEVRCNSMMVDKPCIR